MLGCCHCIRRLVGQTVSRPAPLVPPWRGPFIDQENRRTAILAYLLKCQNNEIQQAGEPLGNGKGSWVMYFPQFLVGMLATSTGVAVWAYLYTGAIWQGVIWGVIAAVLLQAGYFALVFRLVYWRRDTEQEAEAVQDTANQPVGREASPSKGRA